jgi:hypothetical protein
MLEHGMHEPTRIPAPDLEKWQMRYMLEHPAEPEAPPPAEPAANEPKPE